MEKRGGKGGEIVSGRVAFISFILTVWIKKRQAERGAEEKGNLQKIERKWESLK